MPAFVQDPFSNALLGRIGAEERGLFLPHLETLNLPRGQLADAGQQVTHVYFPIDCVISLTVHMTDGSGVETGTIGREGMDGYVAAMGDHQALVRSMVQLPGSAARLPVAVFESAIRTNPRLHQLFLCHTQALIGQIMQLVACNALHGAEARFCRWLLMFRDRAAGETLPLTHEYLSEMLSVQRPTVTLIARTLQAAGLIRYRRGLVEIRDRAGLLEASCECYSIIRANYEKLLPNCFISSVHELTDNVRVAG